MPATDIQEDADTEGAARFDGAGIDDSAGCRTDRDRVTLAQDHAPGRVADITVADRQIEADTLGSGSGDSAGIADGAATVDAGAVVNPGDLPADVVDQRTARQQVDTDPIRAGPFDRAIIGHGAGAVGNQYAVHNSDDQRAA